MFLKTVSVRSYKDGPHHGNRDDDDSQDGSVFNDSMTDMMSVASVWVPRVLFA